MTFCCGLNAIKEDWNSREFFLWSQLMFISLLSYLKKVWQHKLHNHHCDQSAAINKEAMSIIGKKVITHWQLMIVSTC
jgi:ABC-type transport system involved in cytochrome c biogenesis permease component